MSHTRNAMALQPGLLRLDWSKRLEKKVMQQTRGTKSVAFIGTGSSFHCALWSHWLCRSNAKLRIPSRVSTTWDELIAPAPISGRELSVVISHRGNKNLTKRLLATKKSTRRILISGEKSPTGSNPAIFTSPQEVSNAHTMSLVGAMAALSEVVAQLSSQSMARRIRTERLKTADLMEQALVKLAGESAIPRNVLDRKAGLHFVGGGPFHAVALELALKAKEIIHAPAHAYNTEEFLHGPLASVESEDTVVLLTPFSKPRGALQQQLHLGRLDACHRAVETLGCTVVRPVLPEPLAQSAAKLDYTWQAFLHLLWGQELCLTTANEWGINPDLNRRDEPRYEEARLATEEM